MTSALLIAKSSARRLIAACAHRPRGRVLSSCESLTSSKPTVNSWSASRPITMTTTNGHSNGHTEEFQPFLDHLIKDRIGGVIYQSWGYSKSLKEILDLMKGLKVRDDDVIVCGYPRSGNHWAYDVIHMIRNQNTKFAEKHMWYSMIDAKVCSDDMLEKEPSPRYLATHTRPNRLPAEAIEKKTKLIYLLRNPKDAMVSLYRLYGKLKKEDGGFRCTWDEFFDHFLKGELPYGTWFDHVLDMEKHMSDNPSVPVYIHVYEEMKTDPIKCIKNLSEFLEVPMTDSLAEAIAKATGFDNMKNNAKKFTDIEGQIFDTEAGSSSILRKGIIGDWVNDFDAVKNESFEKAFRAKMADSKLAPRIENYTFI